MSSSTSRKLYKVEGVEEIQRALVDMGKRKTTKIVRKGVNKASTYMRKEIKKKVQATFQKKSGRMLKYVKKQAGDRYRVHQARADVGIIGKPGAKDFPFYARILESKWRTVKTGRYNPRTRKRLRDPHNGGPKNPPKIPRASRETISTIMGRPVIIPAFDSGALKAGEIGYKHIWELLKQEFNAATRGTR